MIWIILVGTLDPKTMVMYDNIIANHPDGLASVIFERLVTQCNGEESGKKDMKGNLSLSNALQLIQPKKVAPNWK